jgi:hypothetical protein
VKRNLRLLGVAWLLDFRLLAPEASIGFVYTFFGYRLLLFMERESRKRAALQIA